MIGWVVGYLKETVALASLFGAALLVSWWFYSPAWLWDQFEGWLWEEELVEPVLPGNDGQWYRDMLNGGV
jgi:hypothetical protein